MMEWISVEDRLPDFEVEILFVAASSVYLGEYNLKDITKYASLSNTNVDFWNDEGINRNTCAFITLDEAYGLVAHDDATHWMPLPEPPLMVNLYGGGSRANVITLGKKTEKPPKEE